jgi:hypothetical protein
MMFDEVPFQITHRIDETSEQQIGRKKLLRPDEREEALERTIHIFPLRSLLFKLYRIGCESDRVESHADCSLLITRTTRCA